MLCARLRVFRAPDDPMACERYLQSHREVLEHFDLGGVTSSGRDWFDDTNVLVALLEELASGEVLGGIRLERAGGARPLPLQVALSKLEPNVRRLWSTTGTGGSAELCALFSARRLRGARMGRFLTRIGLTLAVERGISKLYGICDSRSLAANLALGFTVDSRWADHGTLRYPRPDLTAYVLCAELDSWSSSAEDPTREFRHARAGVSMRRTRDEILSIDWDLRFAERELTKSERATHDAVGVR